MNSDAASSPPREPAAQGLPRGERWSPRTWAHFRYLVLQRLHEKGAHTVAELTADPPKPLGFPLDEQELTAVLESARRRRLITRLDPDSGTGPVTPTDEWIVTDRGRSAIGGVTPWLFGQAARLRTFAPLLTIAGALGAWQFLGDWARHGDSKTIAWLVMGTLLGLEAVLIGGVMVRSRKTGADAQSLVAKDWKRWATENPEGHRVAMESFPSIRFVPLLAVCVVGAFAAPQPSTRMTSTGAVHQDPIMVLFQLSPFGIVFLLVFALSIYWWYDWTSRWSRITSMQPEVGDAGCDQVDAQGSDVPPSEAQSSQ